MSTDQVGRASKATFTAWLASHFSGSDTAGAIVVLTQRGTGGYRALVDAMIFNAPSDMLVGAALTLIRGAQVRFTAGRIKSSIVPPHIVLSLLKEAEDALTALHDLARKAAAPATPASAPASAPGTLALDAGLVPDQGTRERARMLAAILEPNFNRNGPLLEGEAIEYCAGVLADLAKAGHRIIFAGEIGPGGVA